MLFYYLERFFNIKGLNSYLLCYIMFLFKYANYEGYNIFDVVFMFS